MLLTCWAQERRFRLWNPIILQLERSRLKFLGPVMAFRFMLTPEWLRWGTVQRRTCKFIIHIQLGCLTIATKCFHLYYLYFIFHCTHVQMSYVLNSYLLTYNIVWDTFWKREFHNFDRLGWNFGITMPNRHLYIYQVESKLDKKKVKSHTAEEVIT